VTYPVLQPCGAIWTPYNTLTHGAWTRMSQHPSDIWIGSAIFMLNCMPILQTDRHTDHAMCGVWRLCIACRRCGI